MAINIKNKPMSRRVAGDTNESPVARQGRRLKLLERERTEWLNTWKELSEFLLPRKGKYLTLGDQANQGEKRHDEIVDGTGTRALRVLAAGMQGGLTSPARPWFRLHFEDEALNKFGPVKNWVDEVQKNMYSVFKRSNFYSAIHSVYQELAGFGNACVFEEADPKQVVRFRPSTAGEYSIATDSRGRVSTVYRRFYQTAEHIVERYPYGNIHQSVKDVLRNDPDKWFQVVHAVFPNKNRNMRYVDNLNFPYKSCHWLYGKTEKFLRQGGYMEQPYFVPRWDLSGTEVYGRGPGHDTLGDIKMLQEMTKSFILAIHKVIDPPLAVPGALRNDDIDWLPGGVNFLDVTDKSGIGALYQINPDLAAMFEEIKDLRLQIKEALYNDLFLMILDRPNMTATEVASRNEEKLLMLGPVIERQFNELLDPIIDRTYSIMERAGMIPEPPPEIEGMNIKVEYISLLAQAQKLVGTQSIDATVAFVGSVAQANPDVLDNIDFDVALREYADMTGAPSKMIRGVEQVQRIRDERAQQEAQMQKMQQMAMMIEGAKQVSEIDTSERNALTDLQESIG